MTAIKPPAVYAEWLPLLDRFADGDDDVLAVMAQGRIEWTNVVADRWIRSAASALSRRLDRLSTATQRRLSVARGELDVLRTMRWIDSQLAPLAAFASLAALRSDVREHFDATCRKWVESTQASLLASASRATDQGQLTRSIRVAALTWPPPGTTIDAAVDAAESLPADGPRRRQVLI